MRRHTHGFGALLIMFGEGEVPVARSVGQRLLRGDLFARRLSSEEMHARVHFAPPLDPCRQSITKQDFAQALLCVDSRV